MNTITRHIIAALFFILFFSEGVFAVASKECGSLIQQTESWTSKGMSAAVQVTFNFSNQTESNLAFTGGYLNYYNPQNAPKIERLLKRDQSGIFQSLPRFVMDNFAFEDASSSYFSDCKLSIERKMTSSWFYYGKAKYLLYRVAQTIPLCQ